MIQDNIALLLCLFFLVISCIVYQYFEITKTKKASLLHIKNIQNKIEEEQLILNQKNKDVVKIKESEIKIHQKLVTLKIDIVTIDFTFREIFTTI